MLKKLLALCLAFFAAVAFAAVDVNKATQAELDGIKGIGPSIAGKILDARKTGPFKDWGDLVERVKGIGEGNAAKFSAEGLTVNGAAFKGAAAAPAAKKDDKPMPAAAAAAKKDDKPMPAAAAAPAPAKKDDKPMTAADKKAAEKAEKDAAKKEKAAAAKKDKEAAAAAKKEKADAAKAEKAAMAAKPAASAAKPAATVASAAKK